MAVEPSTESKEIEQTTENEIDRLKNLEVQNGSIQKALQEMMIKNQNNEQILVKLSALLGELVALSNRTTYIATMIKDIIDNRNQVNPS